MSLHLRFLLAALGFASPPADELAFAPEPPVTLLRTFEARASYTLEEITYLVEGEPVGGAPEAPEVEIESLERIVLRDEIDEIEDGRPTDFLRTFEELLQEATVTFDGQEEEELSESPLEGRTVRLLWDDDDEEYWAETADGGDEIDDELLDGLAGDADFLRLLPEVEVEEGETWQVDPAAYLVPMWPGGLLGFHDERELGQAPHERERDEATVENLDGRGSVTFEERREEDGVSVAVLWVELEITSESESEAEEQGEPVTYLYETERDVEGEVLWDLEHDHLHSAELEADVRSTHRTVRTVEQAGAEVELEQVRVFGGTIDYTLRVERE